MITPIASQQPARTNTRRGGGALSGLLALALLAGMVPPAYTGEVADEAALRSGVEAAVVERADERPYAQVELVATMPPTPPTSHHTKYLQHGWYAIFRFAMVGDKVLVPHPSSLLEPPLTLTLEGETLTGKLYLPAQRGIRELKKAKVVASVTNGVITGTLTYRGRTRGPKGVFYKDREASLAGTIIPETVLAQDNAISGEAAWPSFHGPPMRAISAMPIDTELVTDPGLFRLVWKSGESDIGHGMGNTPNGKTPFWRSRNVRTGSGSSSPILADGKIYLSYTRPTPRPKGAADSPLPGTGRTQGDLLKQMCRDAGVESPDQLPLHAREKAYTYLDHITVCLDAATGKTLWKSVVKARSIGFNLTHKYWGAYNMTPAHANGRVFTTSTSGWVYAFDADTGEPLWERRLSAPLTWEHKFHRLYQTALLAFDDKVIVPYKRDWTCLDAATGDLLWSKESPGGFSNASLPTLWVHDGQRYLLYGGSRIHAGLFCLKATDGSVAWRKPIRIITGGKNCGPGGISISGDTLLVNQDNQDYSNMGEKERRPAVPVLAAYRLTAEGPVPLWELGAKNEHAPAPVYDECNPVVVRGTYAFTADLRVVDLATGDVIDEAQDKSVRPQNGGYMQAMGNMVMTRPDGSHGRIHCGLFWLNADGKITRQASWNHGDGMVKGLDKRVVPNMGLRTTSYHHPLYYPMAEGRLFIRGGDGIYCWDLRKEHEQKENAP